VIFIFALIGTTIAAVTIWQAASTRTLVLPRGLRNVILVYMFWSALVMFLSPHIVV
jgi:hypothetical protein